MILNNWCYHIWSTYTKKLFSNIAFYKDSIWGIETSFYFFSRKYLLLQNGVKTTFIVKLLLVIKWYIVIVDHIHCMSIRHNYTLTIYQKKNSTPRSDITKMSWNFVTPSCTSCCRQGMCVFLHVSHANYGLSFSSNILHFQTGTI